MREEYSAALDGYRQLLPTRLATRYRLDLLSRKQAEEAICEPAVAFDPKVEYKDEAVERLLDELGTVRERTSDGSVATRKVPFIEPLYLQIVCHRLWEILPAGTATISSHQIAPRKGHENGAEEDGLAREVEEALDQYFSSVVTKVASMTKHGERRIRERLEQEFVTPQGLRQQVLKGTHETAGLPNEVVEALTQESLLRSDSRIGATWYEVTHDRIAAVILDGNAKWYQENLQPFQMNAAQWARLRRSGADRLARRQVLGGKELQCAEKWRDQQPAEALSRIDRDFLSYSRTAWNQDRRHRWMLISLALVVVICVVYGDYLEIPGMDSAVGTIRFTESFARHEERISAETGAWLTAADAGAGVRLWSLNGLSGAGYAYHYVGRSTIYALAFIADNEGKGEGMHLAYGGTQVSGVLPVLEGDLGFGAEEIYDLPVTIRALATDAARRRLVIATGNVRDTSWQQE